MIDTVTEVEVNPYPEYAGLPAIELIRAMAEVKRDLETIGDQKSSLEKEYDYLRQRAVPTAMESEGIDRIAVDGIGRVSLTGDLWVSIPAANKDSFFGWLKENGHADLIVAQVNAASLKAMCKQAMKNGEELPVDLLKITPFTRASITKEKP